MEKIDSVNKKKLFRIYFSKCENKYIKYEIILKKN